MPPETYVIEVQRWPLPFYQKHEVLSHTVEGGRLKMVYPTGHIVEIPRLDRRRLRIYPEYLRQAAKIAEPSGDHDEIPLLE
jgi:hypothetical protein